MTIDYAGDFHVDVVPFVTRSDRTYVTNRITEEFEPAAPDDFTEWLEGKNRITNGNLVKVVRLLKYLRDHKTRYTIPSVTLTAALAHHVSETAKAFDLDAYRNVANMLRTLSEELAVQIAGHPFAAPTSRTGARSGPVRPVEGRELQELPGRFHVLRSEDRRGVRRG